MTDPPMTPGTALGELGSMLDAAGFDPDAPRLQSLWPVLREWVTLPVEGMDPDTDGDMVAFETIHSDRPPGRGFWVHFTRQFVHYEDGEYVGMEQIGIDLWYPAHPDFEGRETQFWGVPGARSDAWIRRVESDPAFVTASAREPQLCDMSQDDV